MSSDRRERNLSAAILLDIDRLCEAFEAAWKSGTRPSVSDFLADRQEPVRSAILRELILLDLEYRTRAGERPTPAAYLREFPRDSTLIEDVLRKSFGDAAAADYWVDLMVVAGPHRGKQFRFDRHDAFLVGRAAWAHFRLPRQDPYFSRVHFMVEVNPPICRLYDMGSTNGTRINGQRVESSDLHDGDLIQGGDTWIKVSLGVASPDAISEEAAPQQDRPSRSGVETTETYQPGLPRESGEPLMDISTHSLPVIDGYRVERELGRGGMGVVYQAIRSSDGNQVAIKTIRPAVEGTPDEVVRFLREIAILGRLRHPNIVSLQDCGQSGHLLYFVMDLVQGASAEQLVKSERPLAVERVVSLIGQTLDALDYAHQKGFVHRDVKPANLLVGRDAGGEFCRLADFGLARAFDESRLSGLTMMGDVGGTLPYMPPEQILNYRQAKPPADQYSAAATLYYLPESVMVFSG